MRPTLVLPAATCALLCGAAAAVMAAPKLDSTGGSAVPSAAPAPAPAPPSGSAVPAGEANPEPTPSAPAEIPTPVRREEPEGPAPGPRSKSRSGVLINADADDDSADQPTEVRHARDTLGRHVIVAVRGGLFFPTGSFDDVTYQSDLLGVGPLIGGDIGYGVSHTVVFGAYGELGLPDDQACSTCGGSSFAVGPFVRYHLVQGVRFDPWLSFGVGFRKTTLGSSSWTGVDFLRLGLGGDFYAWPSLGFGPFAELSAGTYFDGNPKLTSHSVNVNFTLGLRVVFDSPGK